MNEKTAKPGLDPDFIEVDITDAIMQARSAETIDLREQVALLREHIRLHQQVSAMLKGVIRGVEKELKAGPSDKLLEMIRDLKAKAEAPGEQEKTNLLLLEHVRRGLDGLLRQCGVVPSESLKMKLVDLGNYVHGLQEMTTHMEQELKAPKAHDLAVEELEGLKKTYGEVMGQLIEIRQLLEAKEGDKTVDLVRALTTAPLSLIAKELDLLHQSLGLDPKKGELFVGALARARGSVSKLKGDLTKQRNEITELRKAISIRSTRITELENAVAALVDNPKKVEEKHATIITNLMKKKGVRWP